MQGDIAGWYKYEDGKEYPIKEIANGSYVVWIGGEKKYVNKDHQIVPIEKNRDVLDKEEHIVGEVVAEVFEAHNFRCLNEYEKNKQISGIDAYLNGIPFDNKAALTYNGANLMTFQMEISATGRGNTPNYTNTYFNHDKGSKYTNIVYTNYAKTFINSTEDVGELEMYLVENSELEKAINEKYKVSTQDIIDASQRAYKYKRDQYAGQLMVKYWNTKEQLSTTIKIPKSLIMDIAILSYKDGKITRKTQKSI